jgi:hypothetical protein
MARLLKQDLPRLYLKSSIYATIIWATARHLLTPQFPDAESIGAALELCMPAVGRPQAPHGHESQPDISATGSEVPLGYLLEDRII